MRYLIYLLIICISTPICNAKSTPKYAVSDIPDSLKKNAFAIVRKNNVSFEVISNKKAIKRVTFAVTIFNKNADKYAIYKVYYDKNESITKFSGSYYDKYGNLKSKSKKKDVYDHDIVDYSLFDDNRLKYLNCISNEYPYTIEFEYEKTYNGFIYIDTWKPINDEDVGMEKSIFKLKIPLSYKTNIKEINCDRVKKHYTEEGFTRITEWKIENQKPIKYEPYSDVSSSYLPIVYIVPQDFYYCGTHGSNESWDTYGKWVNSLVEPTQDLSIETKKKVIQLTTPLKDTLLKIKKVYEYLQSNTRYVSISLGIGGYQPFPASTVDELGYGDCKALSNYTKCLLDTIGIKSYYTEVYSGFPNKKYPTDFVSTALGNHIILTIPINNDTLWLECTSQTLPFGFIHKDISGREALQFTENGAKLINIPGYTKEHNLKSRVINANIQTEGNAIAKVLTKYFAMRYDDMYSILLKSPDEQEKSLYKKIEIPSFKINSFSFINNKDINPSAIAKLDLSIPNYASKSGKRLFIPLNLMNKRSSIPREVDNRKTNVKLNYSYTDIDTITYRYPENYSIEYIPENIEIKSIFGDYSTFINNEGNTITYIRKISMNKGTYPPKKYDELIKFFKDIVKADKVKAILVLNE